MAWQVRIKKEYVEEPELEESEGISDVLTTTESTFTEYNVKIIKTEQIENRDENIMIMKAESPAAAFTCSTITIEKMEKDSDTESITSDEKTFEDSYTDHYNTLSRSSDTDDNQVTEQAKQRGYDPIQPDLTTTEATAIYLDLADKGDLSYEIEENDFCAKSLFTGWHLQQSIGVMRIKLTSKDITAAGPVTVRILLMRKDKTYMAYTVDQICKNHLKEIGDELLTDEAASKNVLKGANGFDWYYGQNGPRKSICFDIPNPDNNRTINATVGFRNICSDACPTSSDPSYKHPEKGRDKIAIITIENKDSTVIARRSFSLWTKSVIRQIDLNKRKRREPKGGAAKKAIHGRIKNTRIKNNKGGTGITNKHCKKNQKSKVISGPISLQVGNNKEAHTQTNFNREENGHNLRLVPLTWNHLKTNSATPGSACLSKKHIINILTQVESLQKIPTNREILKSILKHCVYKAKFLNITNTELHNMINTELFELHGSSDHNQQHKYEKGALKTSAVGITRRFNGNQWRRLCSNKNCSKESNRQGHCAEHMKSKEGCMPSDYQEETTSKKK